MSTMNNSMLTLTADSIGRPQKLVLRCAALRVARGPLAGQELELTHTPWLVGKHASCDLILDDPTISSRHAEIVLRPGGYLMKDLGSRNGVLAGNWRVEQIYLSPGMVLTLGNAMLEVVDLHRSKEIDLSVENQFNGLWGQSLAMRRVFALLESISHSSTTVLFEGETGTGKGAFAEALHHESPFADGPFVVFDCSAISPTLLESELFGHEKGAFTGATSTYAGALERAARGTLFIDEIGELSLDLQPKLLRAVESRQFRRVGGANIRSVNARIIAATHKNLEHMISQGTFRQDLFYRLAVVRIHIPPLRERVEDLPLLLEHFSNMLGQPATVRARFPGLLPLLVAYHWPGNVRELRNVVERLGLLPLEQALPGAMDLPENLEAKPMNFGEARDRALVQFERVYLEDVLRWTHGKVTDAAELAGVSRRYLTRLMAKHQLDRHNYQLD